MAAADLLIGFSRCDPADLELHDFAILSAHPKRASICLHIYRLHSILVQSAFSILKGSFAVHGVDRPMVLATTHICELASQRCILSDI